MRNVLVTGGAGFIGSNFVRYLLHIDPDIRIVNLDALTYSGSPESLKDLDRERHIFVKGDICDFDLISKLLRQFKIDTLINFAAETHVDRSIIEPQQFVRTNIFGTSVLLDQAYKYWNECFKFDKTTFRFHHISTDEVFGSLPRDDPPWPEDARYEPRSPYAASKAASDHLVRAYGHTYGLPYSITNSSNNYGPYQFPEKLVPLITLNALEGKLLPVYGDGQQIRDWLHVGDNCEAIYLTISKGKVGNSYNVGGGNQPTNIMIVETICDILDNIQPLINSKSRRQLIRFVEDRPGHDRRYALDIRKINRDLGWQPKYVLQEGLQKTVEWYLRHYDWVKAIKQKGNYEEWLDKNYSNRQLKET